MWTILSRSSPHRDTRFLQLDPNVPEAIEERDWEHAMSAVTDTREFIDEGPCTDSEFPTAIFPSVRVPTDVQTSPQTDSEELICDGPDRETPDPPYML